MAFRTWAHKRVPLLETCNGKYLRTVVPISTIVSLLILCTKNIFRAVITRR